MDLLNLDDTQTVGVVVALVALVVAVIFFFVSSKKPKVCLDPEKFKNFKLVQRTQLSHNVAKFRFELPTPTSVLGLPIGQHISCRGKDGVGEEVIKAYTPTTLDSDVGYFELVIKMYPQGRMSHHFRELRVGDHLSVKGPRGRFRYQPGQVRAFGMLAGGSGITPMFQKRSNINKQSRGKVGYTHKLGSKTYAATLHIMDDGDADVDANASLESNYIELYKSSCFNAKTGKWANQSCEENYMMLKQQWSEAQETGMEISIPELFQQVLGKEFSFFRKKSSSGTYAIHKQHKEEVQKLRDTIVDLTKANDEKFETQEKTIESLQKRVEETQNQQLEFMRMVMAYHRSKEGSSSPMENIRD